MSGKWLELLKEIAPRVIRVGVIRDPAVPAGSGGLAAIQIAAPSFGVELTPIGVRSADEIERGVATLARSANGGLIVVGPMSSVQFIAISSSRLRPGTGCPRSTAAQCGASPAG